MRKYLIVGKKVRFEPIVPFKGMYVLLGGGEVLWGFSGPVGWYVLAWGKPQIIHTPDPQTLRIQDMTLS